MSTPTSVQSTDQPEQSPRPAQSPQSALQPTPQHIAIVGSGPSGCFIAQALRRAWRDAEITVFDRLAVPYGLIRYGVAADHQHTKAITRQFDRAFMGGDVRFAGNVEIGNDLSLEELRSCFDLVVLASGRWRDRRLTVPGARLPGVVPSGDIINALNAVPRPGLPMPEIGERVVVVGGGNVAIDIVRFLAKRAEDYAGSDVASTALDRYLVAPARQVTVLSRSPIASAKSDVAMVKELGRIPRVRYTYSNSSRASEDNTLGRKREEAFAALAALEAPDPRLHVHFVFGAVPDRITGDQRVEAVRLAAAPAGEPGTVPADTVISAIGFDVNAPGHNHYAEHLDFSPSEDSGRIEPGLYRAGWLKRGPVGAIPANRADSNEVAKEIIADVESGLTPLTGDKHGFASLPARVREQAVSFEAWQRIDEAERAAAPEDRVRHKLVDHDAMVAIALAEAAGASVRAGTEAGVPAATAH
ncbi:FAD-dependent oxidoreductase [Brevibacterium daeguense]|uniref:ferredoxin--NADP(+) reductase n=1 Tax=Brevibacterium daeguense TaxID=909936 RepID=A0ABP8EJX7_9MICO|nr:FAD-dependent oxidoreductase [Brevibacterium daeguense]